MPLAEKAQGGTVDNPAPLAQPGPSPGTGSPPVVVVAPTAKALAFRMGSGLFHFNARNDGVLVSAPILSLVAICPPKAYESVPPVTSLNSNCIAFMVKFFPTGASKSQESFWLKPSGLMSGSPVTAVRFQV